MNHPCSCGNNSKIDVDGKYVCYRCYYDDDEYRARFGKDGCKDEPNRKEQHGKDRPV